MIAIVKIIGEFSHDFVEVLQRGVSERMEKGVRDFVLELDQMAFVDSAGLECLLWLQDSAAEELGQVRLVNPNDDVRKILEITRLDGQFETHEEATDAIRSLR